MMQCNEYRRSLLTQPREPSAAMSAHVEGCAECSEYTERVLRFESRLDRALRVTVGTDAANGSAALSAPLQSQRRAMPYRWRKGLAVAASFLVAAVVAGSLWVAAPDSSLAADVVDHMAKEPNAWARTDRLVPPSQLEQVMNDSHLQLRTSAGLVSYANSCLFRGHRVPHLVVQTTDGPVTVMVLTHESVKRAERFDEHGYRGMIVPVPQHGSLAVLERGPRTSMQVMQSVASQVLRAVEWTS